MRESNALRLIAIVALMVAISPFQNCSKQLLGGQEIVFSSLITPICRDISAPEVTPTLKYAWDYTVDVEPTYKQVLAAPSVGILESGGQPVIAFTSYVGTSHNGKGVLRVLNGSDGSSKFSVSDSSLAPLGSMTPLLVDIDRDGTTEIVYLHYDEKKVIALNFDGSLRWTFALPSEITSCGQGFSAANLFNDNKTQILAGPYILGENDQKQGYLIAATSIPRSSCASFAASLDLTVGSAMKIIGTDGVYNNLGVKEWSFTRTGLPAIGDLMKNVPGAEIVVVKNGYFSIYNGLTGAVLVDKSLNEHSELQCSGGVIGGGQATIGDFDGVTETLEVAVATGRSLTIFNNEGETMAGSVSQDCSSKVTGLTSFDFNGDGQPEIIYADEQYIRMYTMDGTAELKVVWSSINPSRTLHEYPVVADVDNDETADLIVVANNYTVNSLYNSTSDRQIAGQITGLRVFGPTGANAWMPTRSVWNQYSFFSANIDDTMQATASTIFDFFKASSFKRNTQKGMYEGQCVYE